MKTLERLLCLLTGCVALSLGTIAATPANAAILSWSLTFTSGDRLVGTGEFSYDDEKVVVVKSPVPYSDFYIADKDAPIRSDFLNPSFPGLWTVTQYPNPIVSFRAELPGQTWSLTYPSWWSPESSTSVLGYFGCYRLACFVSNQWFAGSPSGTVPGQFAMFGGERLADDQYTGTFISAPIPSSSSTSPSFLVGGTWTATAVPEPTTIVGAVMGAVGFLLSKKRDR